MTLQGGAFVLINEQKSEAQRELPTGFPAGGGSGVGAQISFLRLQPGVGRARQGVNDPLQRA